MIHLTHYGAWRVAVSVFHGSQQASFDAEKRRNHRELGF
jgi:hypothetical protein